MGEERNGGREVEGVMEEGSNGGREGEGGMEVKVGMVREEAAHHVLCNKTGDVPDAQNDVPGIMYSTCMV